MPPKKNALAKSGGDEPAEKFKVSKKKTTKAEGAPKKPLTSFFLWMKDNRERLKSEGYTGKETATRGGEEWRELSEKQKQPYLNQAAELKEEYERAMKNLGLK